MRLERRRALATGAGAGISLAVASRFRDEGARVFARDRGKTLLDAIARVGQPVDACNEGVP